MFAMATTDIKAPASVVWECIADLEAAPRIIGMVVSMERCVSEGEDEGEKTFAFGTRWKETRVHQGMEFHQQKTITALSEGKDDPPGYSVCIAVTYPTGDRTLTSVTNTSTLTVTALTETTSRLVGTFATRYGFFLKLFLLLSCDPCRTREYKLVFQTEMEDYGAEAEKRYQATLANKVQSQ
jgi:hypothetical protein